jgi:hypothetical protein
MEEHHRPHFNQTPQSPGSLTRVTNLFDYRLKIPELPVVSKVTKSRSRDVITQLEPARHFYIHHPVGAVVLGFVPQDLSKITYPLGCSHASARKALHASMIGFWDRRDLAAVWLLAS